MTHTPGSHHRLLRRSGRPPHQRRDAHRRDCPGRPGRVDLHRHRRRPHRGPHRPDLRQRRLPSLDSAVGSQWRHHSALTSGTDAAEIGDIVAPVTGTYLVLVGSFDSGFDGTGTYRLTMTQTPGPITVIHRRSGRSADQRRRCTPARFCKGDLDVWTFTANAGRANRRAHRRNHGQRRLPALDSPVGSQRRQLSAPRPALTRREIGDVIAPVTGTYLVLVGSFDSGFDGTGTYRLTMTTTPGPITVSAGRSGRPPHQRRDPHRRDRPGRSGRVDLHRHRRRTHRVAHRRDRRDRRFPARGSGCGLPMALSLGSTSGTDAAEIGRHRRARHGHLSRAGRAASTAASTAPALIASP